MDFYKWDFLICLVLVVLLATLALTPNPNDDSMGRGMAQGFLFFMGAGVVLAGILAAIIKWIL